MKKVILIGMLALTVEASALGIHSKELTQTCEGTVKSTSVEKVGVSGGLHDRAGNYHPPHGYAYINYEVQDLGEGCEAFEKAKGIDLKAKKFSDYTRVIQKSIIPNDLWPTKLKPINGLRALHPAPPFFNDAHFTKKDVFNKAKELIGKTYSFELVHHISHQQEDGFLPFYPLVHSESFNLKANGVGSFDLKVKNIKKKLSLKEHGDLADAFFEFIGSDESKGFYSSSVLKTLLDQTPFAHQTYLEDFIPKVIDLYEIEELSFNSESPFYSQSDSLFYIVKFLKKVSHQHNWTTKMSNVDFVLSHPSLLHSDTKYVDSSCLNMNAIQLEDFMSDLEYALFAGQFSEQEKQNWKDPLEQVAGSSYPSKCLSQVASKASKALAQDLLEMHY